RWLVCGGILAAVALTKGPQPVGFFALGVGGYLIARRHWKALTGLAVCLGVPALATIGWAAGVYRAGDLPVWFYYLRLDHVGVNFTHYARERVRFAGGLPLDLLPNTLLLPSAIASWRREIRAGTQSCPVLLPLALYAGICTLALLLWPGVKTRY